VLNISTLDAETSFFDLGGHSLLALRMLADIRQETRYDLTLPELFQGPTIRALAQRVDEANSRSHADASLQSLIPIRTIGSGPAVFMIPGGNGGDRELFVHVSLGRNHFGPGIRSFGLRARGHKSGTYPHRSLRELASDYIQEMRTVSKGPYHLVGDCTGGNVAFEIACQLQAMGLEVGLLALCDCSRPRSFEFARYVVQSRYQRFRRSFVGRSIAALAKVPLLVTRNGRQLWTARLRNLTQPLAAKLKGSSVQAVSRVPEPEYWTPLGERYRRTVTTHSPRRFNGSIVHFLSQTHQSNPRMLAWADHITGKQHLHVLDGDHWHYLWENGPLVNQIVSASIQAPPSPTSSINPPASAVAGPGRSA
jgi:thioesterase domain-containing protein